MFTIAAYCQEESRKAGTTTAQYKAAIQLIREALHDMRRIDANPIAVTQHKKYRVWWRLKLKNAPAVTYRASVEIAEDGVLLHLVLPRTSSTYAEVEKLWKAHRTALPDAEE
jgi:hypothetical protein